MRPVTRNAVVFVAVVVVFLLALGAVPGLLQSGDPYYLVADPVEDEGSTDAATAVNGTALPAQRFPYTTAALAEGTSEPYWEGPVGLKESFTHSPFDEVAELESRNADAVTDEGVLVRDNGTLYTVAVRRDP